MAAAGGGACERSYPGGRGTAGGVDYEVQITARAPYLPWPATAKDARKNRRSRPDPVKAWERAIAYILQVMRSSG